MRAGVLRGPEGRDFRTFWAGYATSLLGTAMSTPAVAFAVLDGGGDAADLGWVMAAGIAPQVVFLLLGGVAADRFGRRRVMLGADALRCAAQAAFAAALLLDHGRPQIWLFVLLAAVRGTGEGFFRPALSALTVEITPVDRLGDANALLGLARSAAAVAGPALAGLLITVAGPAVVIAVDAASYGVSVLALGRLRIPASSLVAAASRSLRRDLAEGWAEFRAHSWLVVTTVQFTFVNLVVWGPFLLLGPVLFDRRPGGAGAWGLTMAAYGAGAVAGGLLALGRRPGRPLVGATVATLGYGVPCALLAVHAGVALIAAGALVAGAGSALAAAFSGTVLQQQVPAGALARVSSFQTLGSYSAGPLGLAAAGPAAALFGAGTVLAFAAAWATLSALAVLAAPAVRRITWPPPPTGTGADAHPSDGSAAVPGAVTRRRRGRG